ncbi:MAG: putative DNA-binding domain-containing protein [Phaeodactylibacter sp.]|nr:putative DNA-binding domain-containing protein [Phaeodactylibacter sp.]
MDKPGKHSNLQQVQAWMQEALIHSGEHTSIKAVESWIEASQTLSPQQRLGIYQRSYYARLLTCLQAQYKALCTALGLELFNDFAREYLKTYPSQSPTLSELGGRFPAFLEQTRPDRAASVREVWIDFMIDLARYEWALYLLFDAPGDERNGYAAPETPDDRLRLQVCFSLQQYGFPVSDYYNAVATSADAPLPDPAQCYLALVRKDYRIGTFRLSAVQYNFLEQLQSGATIATAGRQTAAHFKIAETAFFEAWPTWKSNWAKGGFFVCNA